MQNLERLESLMNGNSTEELIADMVAETNGREPMHSSHGYDCKIWDEFGELTTKGARFIDSTNVEFLNSLGKGSDGTDEVIGCLLCGRAVMKSSEQRECIVCENTYCVDCVWPTNFQPDSGQKHGCRRRNGSPTWVTETISKHPYGLCGDDQCWYRRGCWEESALLLGRVLW